MMLSLNQGQQNIKLILYAKLYPVTLIVASGRQVFASTLCS